MDNWFELFGLKREHAHCSRHAHGDDLREIVSQIKPRVLFLIYTKSPSKFKALNFKSKIVKGDNY